MSKKETIADTIESVCEEMCDKYCKYKDELNKAKDDEEYDEMIDSICGKCPLNRLH